MDYPCVKGTPSFKDTNEIAPTATGSKKSGKMDKSMWSSDALGSEIKATGKHAKKGKGATVNASVAKSKANVISPTKDY